MPSEDPDQDPDQDPVQDPEVLLQKGTQIGNLGKIKALEGLAIDDAGHALVLAEFDGKSARNECLLLDSVPILAEGAGVWGQLGLSIEGLVAPFPLGLRDLSEFPLNSQAPWIAELGGRDIKPGSTALFFGTDLAASTAERVKEENASGQHYWRSFRGLSTFDGDCLLVARIAAGSKPSDTALYRCRPSESAGFDFVPLLRAGDRLVDADSTRLLQLSEAPRGLALSSGGDWAVAAELQADNQTLGAILRQGQVALCDGDVCCESGGEAHQLERSVLALDGHAGLAWIGLVSSDAAPARETLVVDNRIVAQVGQPVAELPLELGPLVSFGIGSPLLRAPAGRVLWFGRFEAEDQERDTAILMGEEILVREGDRTSNGSTIDVLFEGAGSLTLSPNGRWLLFDARLADGKAGVFRVDLGTVESEGENQAGRLRLRSGRVAPGQELVFEYTHTPGSNSTLSGGYLLMSNELRESGQPASRWTTFGELRIDPANTRMKEGSVDQRCRRVEFRVTLPRESPAPGTSLVVQGIGLNQAEPATLSNALKILF